MIGRVVSQVVALLRHLRVERTLIVTVAVVVCLTSLVMASIPRLYTAMLDDELAFRTNEAPHLARNLSVSLQHRMPQSDGADDDRFRRKGENYQAQLPESIQAVVTGNEYLVDSPNLTALPIRKDAPEFLRSLRLRLMSNVDEHIRLEAGRQPMVQEPIVLSEWLNIPGARGETRKPRFEVLISERTATELGLRLAELTRVVVNFEGHQAIVEVVGIVSVPDPEANFWNDDTRFAQPFIIGFATDFGQIIIGTALIAPGAFNQVYEAVSSELTYTWNYYVEPDGLTTANYVDVIAKAKQVQLTKGPTDELLLGQSDHFTIQNDLPLLLNDFALQTNVALTVIALTTTGLLVTGLAALALLAALIADRRQATIALLRGRGASSLQLFTAQIVEGLILCGPAALLGYGLALLLVDSRPNQWSLVGSAATALLTVALLVVASRVNISTALGALLSRGGLFRGRTSLRRLAIEGAVILVAVAGIVLLRRRGLEPNVTAEGDVSFDPFLTAVPILLTLAVGLLSLRLYPLLMRVAARIAGMGRGLVVFVGLRRVSGQSLVVHLPLLVMLLAVGISIFSAVVRYSIAEAQAEGAWQRVGAPYRVETPAGPIPDQIDLEAIAGVTGVAEAVQADSGPGTLLAVETDDLAAMNAGTRADPRFPLSLSGVPGGVALGTERNPLPAVVAANWTEDEIRRGSLLTVNIPAQSRSIELVIRIDEVRTTFAGLPEDEPFVVVSLPALQAAAPDAQLRPNVAYLSGEGLTADGINEAIDEQFGENDPIAGGVRAFLDSDVTSRVEAYESIRDAPLSQGVTRSFALGVAMATLYAVLAIVTALTLTARARSRDLSYLRTLGLSQRQAMRLSVVEHIPSVILASLLGALLGVGIVRLIEPGLNVAAFVGPGTSVPLRTDWLTITIVTLALTLVTTGALALYTAINRRTQLSQTLRVGDG